MIWRRRIFLAVLAALLLVALAYGFSPKAQPVEIAQVTRGPLQVTVQEEGKTRVIDRFVVSAPVTGYLRRIELKVGDVVQQGQVLSVLEPPRPPVLDTRSRAEAEARVEATAAALRAAQQQTAAARAEAERARVAHRRLVDLCKVQCASKEAEDQAQTRVLTTAAMLSAAEAAAETARFEHEAARSVWRYSAVQGTTRRGELVPLKAPVAGTLLKLRRESEGMVQAGEPLLELGDPQRLEVATEVLSTDAVRIQPGMAVIFERWGGGEALDGKVRRIEPTGFTKVSALGVEEQRVVVIADFTSDPQRWRHVGDGYRVESNFVLWRSENVLRVPSSALFREGEVWSVFVVEDGKANKRTVRTGQRDGLVAEILSGLSEGEHVITHPDNALSDGVRVQPR